MGVVAAFVVVAACAGAARPDVVVLAATVTSPAPPPTLPPTTLAPTTATTAAAPPPSPTTTTASVSSAPLAPAPCAVSFVADSVGTGVLRNGLADDLGGVLCPMVWHAAYGGMPIDVGIDLLARAGDQPSNVALVMLGFHNARTEVGAGRFPAWIDAVVAAAGGRTVVWPMLAYTNGCSAGYKAALTQADADLAQAQAHWPNLVLVDYPTFLATHPEFDLHDCPHLTAAGYRAVGAWLAGEVRRIVQERGS